MPPLSRPLVGLDSAAEWFLRLNGFFTILNFVHIEVAQGGSTAYRCRRSGDASGRRACRPSGGGPGRQRRGAAERLGIAGSSLSRVANFQRLGAPAPDYDEWTGMNNIISEYQKWKQQGEDLRVQAKQAMESRFRELLVEAVQIAEEYRSDFGAPLNPPPGVTSFRYKTSAKLKPKKTQKPRAAAEGAIPAPTAPANTDPKTARLQKRLSAAQKKLEQAKASGALTKNLEDRVYEIEDAIRLST